MRRLLLFFLFIFSIVINCVAQPMQHDEQRADSLLSIASEPFFKGTVHFNLRLTRLEQKAAQSQNPGLLIRLQIIKSELRLHNADTAGATLQINKAAELLNDVTDEKAVTNLQAQLATLYIRAGNKTRGANMLRQSALGARDKPAYSDEWLLAVQARSLAYALLNNNEKITAEYSGAANVAKQAGPQPLYKVNNVFAETFLLAGNTKKAFEVLDALTSDTGFTAAQTKQLYSRLIIYSVKAGRYNRLTEYYTCLNRLKAVAANREILNESRFATGLYKEYLGIAKDAEAAYRQLAADYRQHGPTQTNLEGVIRLTALYIKTVPDSAAYYLSLLKKEFTGCLLQTLTGKLYLQTLAAYKSGKTSPLLQPDTAYQTRLYAATRELEYQYQVLKQKQDNALLKQRQQLQNLTHAKKQQQYLLYILILALIVVIAISISLLMLWRRRQAEKAHEAERLRLEHEHKAELARSFTEAQEEERATIAETLHSEVGAMLAVARLNLSIDDRETTKVTTEQIRVAAGILARLTQTIRDMSHQLMPLGLKQMGLGAAIEELVKEINLSSIVKAETLFVNLDKTPLADDVQVNIYRIVQELFQNMLKHAEATQAFLQIVRHPDSLNIMFEDNGKGITMTASNGGAGMAMMRKRAEYYGGDITVESPEGGGSIITIDLKL